MRLAAALLVLGAVAIRDVRAEGIPCYDCRNESCPTLKAPPCLGARREGSRPTDRRPTRPRTPAPERPPAEPLPRDRSDPVPGAPGSISPADAPVEAVPRAPEVISKEAAEPVPVPVPPISASTPALPPSPPAQPRPLALEAPPPQRASSNPPITPRKYRGAAIGLGVSGILLLAAGGALLAINGSYRECMVDSDITSCQHVLNTWPLGAGLAIAGATGLGSAIVLFAITPRRSAQRVALQLPYFAPGLVLYR